MSTLKRLFDYASAEGNRPLENFTTEALALAIKSDWTPIVEVLRRHPLVGTGSVESVRPETQVHVRLDGQSGYLDLVLHIETTERQTDIWFENKAHAPESGHQLDLYRAALAASQDDGVDRRLVVLAPTPIGIEYGYTFIRWQEVVDAAMAMPEARVWADFAAFLKEYRMVADATLPITPSEAHSLGDAHHLFQKMDFVLRQVNRLARDIAPGWGDEWWVKDRDISRKMTAEFVRLGRLRLWARRDGYAARLVWGAEPHPDGAHFVVLVEVSLKRPAVRSEVLRAVEGRLPDWERPPGRARLIAKERLAVDFASDDEAITWFLGCLGELKAAGILALIPTLKKGPVAIEGEGHETDGVEHVVSSIVTPETEPAGHERVTSVD